MIIERCERRSFLTSLGYGLTEFLGIDSRKVKTEIFLSHKYAYELLNIVLAKKHFQIIDGWVKPKSRVLDSWRLNALTNTSINQLMAIDGRVWHRRKLEKVEIMSLQREFNILEKYLEKRRNIAKIYQDHIEECGLSKISTPENSVASYLKYPVLFSDEKRLFTCAKNIVKAGFTVNYTGRPLHRSPFFGDMNESSSFKESTYISNHILPLPIDPAMNIEELNKIISIVNRKS